MTGPRGSVRRALSPREAFTRYAARFDPVTDPRVRRLLGIELVVVLMVTFGLSGAFAVLDLISALLAPEDLAEQTAALNVSRSTYRGSTWRTNSSQWSGSSPGPYCRWSCWCTPVSGRGRSVWSGIAPGGRWRGRWR